MSRIGLVILFAGTSSLLAGTAAASVDEEARQSVRVDAGLFSAIGELGAVYQLDIGSHLAAEGGIGVGFTGVQLSAMGKGVLPVGRIGALTTGVGLSLAVPALGIKGAQTAYVDGEPTPSGETVPWLNLDLLGLQQRYGATVVAAAVGLTLPLRSYEYDVAELGGTIERFAPIPQARIGIGRAF